MLYELAKPALFSFPAATAHEIAMMALGAGEHSALVRDAMARSFAPRVAEGALRVDKLGLSFRNPVGLAGGFDKNALRPRSLAAFGFGFLELGTVTAVAQDANPSPNLFRLPKDHALINRLGFPNEGAAAVARRIEGRIGLRGARRDMPVPVGVSIGKSRVVDVEDFRSVVEDYLVAFEAVRPVADFIVVNVSSPNTKDLRRIQGPALARDLFSALAVRRHKVGDTVPLLAKVAPDLDDAELDALFDVAADCEFAGVVATNTTLSRKNLVTDAAAVRDVGAGGLSGPPLHPRACAVVARARRRLGDQATIIGVGGICDAAGARAMFAAGADLVQVYTGFVYGGPSFVRDVVEGLVQA